MTQIVALLAAGIAAAGIWFAGSFSLLVACWVLGTVLHGGLVLATANPRVRDVTREIVLAEMLGAWGLLMGGLNLVLKTGAVDLATAGAVAPATRDLSWTGLGLLLLVAARLGLPPVGPWPARLAASPPAVRVFLQSSLYPLTAHLLWWRLDIWLLPWHRHAGMWLGGLAALAAVLAAAGERQLPRRAALLGAAAWAGLLPLTVWGDEPSWLVLAAVAVGAMALQLVAAGPRWPRRWRRGLLLTGGVGLVLGAGAGVRDASSLVVALPVLLWLILLLVVLIHWWRNVAPSREAAMEPRQSAWPRLTWLARQSRRPGPLPRLTAVATQRLSNLVAAIDKVVLDGVVEGLALMSLGAGWLVAWADRRGLDAVERGFTSLTVSTGRWTRTLVTAGPSRLVFLVGLLVMALILVGGRLT